MSRSLLNIILVGVLAIFVIVTFSFSVNEHRYLPLSNLQISIQNDFGFLTEDEVEQSISAYFNSDSAPFLDTLNSENIELLLMKNPWIQHVEVFKAFNDDTLGFAGVLKLQIELEKPIARIANGLDGFYVSSNNSILPLTGHGAYKMPVISGNIDETFATGDFYSFLLYLNADGFWKNQIQQIYVNKKEELILAPRVGDHRIVFGKAERIDEKFRNLKVLYDNALADGSLNQYDEINLKFKNQVVCSKK